jgi:predicted DNA-binding transcriptional regulator AlpA
MLANSNRLVEADRLIVDTDGTQHPVTLPQARRIVGLSSGFVGSESRGWIRERRLKPRATTP